MNAATNEEGNALLETAVLGKRLENFLNTDIGQFIIKRCDDDIEIAMQKLKTCSSWRRNRIMELQSQIRTLESFKGWLLSAVVDGIRATEVLQDE